MHSTRLQRQEYSVGREIGARQHSPRGRWFSWCSRRTAYRSATTAPIHERQSRTTILMPLKRPKSEAARRWWHNSAPSAPGSGSPEAGGRTLAPAPGSCPTRNRCFQSAHRLRAQSAGPVQPALHALRVESNANPFAAPHSFCYSAVATVATSDFR